MLLLRKIGKIVISVKIKNSGVFMLNKNFYKTIILIIIVFICFLSNSIVASAVTEQQSEGWIYTIEDNVVKITGYTGTETVLNIPSEIDGYQVYSITGLAGNNNITEVNIPESVEGIEDNAFCNCENLKTVNCPSTLLYIGIGAFENCVELSNVRLTSDNLYIYDYAFNNTSLRVISIKYRPVINKHSFPKGSVFADNFLKYLLYKFCTFLPNELLELNLTIVVLVLVFTLSVFIYLVYKAFVLIKRRFGIDENYKYRLYSDNFRSLLDTTKDYSDAYFVLKKRRGYFSFLKTIFIVIFVLSIFIILISIVLKISDIFLPIVQYYFICVLLTVILLIFIFYIIYKIWEYIYSKFGNIKDIRNLRMKSSIRIKRCNKRWGRRE